MSILKIHKIDKGPFETDGGLWYNLCLVETESGELLHQEILYPTMNEAYEDIKTLATSIYPIEIEANYV